MNKRLLVLIGFVSVLVSACHHTKKITKELPPPPVENSLAKLAADIEQNGIQYSWLRIKTGLSYEDPDKSYSVNSQLKLQKDKLIWGSVSMLIELFRAEINPDSAVLLNRTAHEYSTFPVSDLQRTFAIEGLNLQALQRLLLAEPPFGLAEGSKLIAGAGNYVIERTIPTFKEEMRIDAATRRITRYRFEKNASQFIEVNYSNFMQAEGRTLPGKIEFNIASPDKIKITLDVSDYTFLDTDEAPFSIPSSYHKK